jgi:hypothetical protein
LEVKNAAEYEDRLFTSKEADLAVKHAELVLYPLLQRSWKRCGQRKHR